MIPKNADKIIAARMKGLRPAAMVLVALTDPPQGVAAGIDNPVVIAKPGIAYDWRWVRGLDVCVYVRNEDEWPNLVTDIAKQRPAHLELWNHADKWGAHVYLVPTTQDVANPVRMWRYELDFLPWMDFQNRDFVERRRYERDEHGIPFAVC